MAQNKNVTNETVNGEELKKETSEAAVTEEQVAPAEVAEVAEVKENWFTKAGKAIVGTVKKHGKGFAAGVGVTLVAGTATLMALANKADPDEDGPVVDTTATEVPGEE